MQIFFINYVILFIKLIISDGIKKLSQQIWKLILNLKNTFSTNFSSLQQFQKIQNTDTKNSTPQTLRDKF